MRRPGLRDAGVLGPRRIFNLVVFILVPGFLEVVLQLFLRVPPALADGSHLLGSGCSMGVLVGTKVALRSFACFAHKGIVPPGALFRKGRKASFRTAASELLQCTPSAVCCTYG